MKAELHLPPEIIRAIASEVVELLRPMLAGNDEKAEAEDRLLTVKALSEYTGLSRQWIYNNKLKLEPVYLNGKPLFWKSRIKAMLEPERPQQDKASFS